MNFSGCGWVNGSFVECVNVDAITEFSFNFPLKWVLLVLAIAFVISMFLRLWISKEP